MLSSEPANDAPYRLIDDVRFGADVVVHAFTNLYGCKIGDGTRIGTFVEIQRGAVIGSRCKVQSHTFICDGVEIGDEVFVGHGVMFINDRSPRATVDGRRAGAADWRLEPIKVGDGAAIGSAAVITLSSSSTFSPVSALTGTTSASGVVAVSCSSIGNI